MPVSLSSIRAARERIAGSILHSPTPYSLSLSRLCGCEIYCKLEHLQMTGSFKERGARNKLVQLTDSEKKRGVVACSAGNHALGLAYHGQQLGIPVTVAMPKFAPMIKVANCRSFGANVVLYGESYADALAHARALEKERGFLFIPGFDDPDIISGQGTAGLEILEDVPDADAVIVPVGGGGLIAGIATAIKTVSPEIKVIGVEPVNAPTVKESLDRGQVTRIDTKPTLADGLAIAEVVKMCFDLIRKYVDEVVLVNEAQIALAVLRLLEMEKQVVEGAGAVPLAAAMNCEQFGLKGKKVVLVLAGGNIDVTVISRVIERGLAAEGRLCRLTVHVSDRPGSLARLTNLVASTGASVKEVNHDREFAPADVALVSISFILETRDFEHIKEIHRVLKEAGVNVASGKQGTQPG
ncbi:MAG: threonine ammonia-lyase [Tepidisphaeraceae bacterium]